MRCVSQCVIKVDKLANFNFANIINKSYPAIHTRNSNRFIYKKCIKELIQ